MGEGPLDPSERAEVAAFLAAVAPAGPDPERGRDREAPPGGIGSGRERLHQIPRGKVIVRKGDEITPRTSVWVAAVRASVSDPSSWVKVTGILILQTLAAIAFWLDARRYVRRRRERPPETIYASMASAGILFALLLRGFFVLAQGFSSSFEGAATAAATYYALPFAAGPIVAGLVSGMGPALLFAAATRSAPVS